MKRVRAKLNFSEANSSDEEEESSKVPSQKPKCAEPPPVKEMDHRKALNGKIEKFDKTMNQNEPKVSSDSSLDAGIFSQESKDFLNSTPVEEMDHQNALHGEIEKFDETVKKNKAKINDRPSLGAEKLSEENKDAGKDVNTSTPLKEMEHLIVLHPEIEKSLYMKKHHELIFKGQGPLPFIVEKLTKQKKTLKLE